MNVRCLLVSFLLSTVLTGCQEVFEFIMPKSTDKDRQQGRLKGYPSYFKSLDETVDIIKRGALGRDDVLPLRSDPNRSEELTKLLEKMLGHYYLGRYDKTIPAAKEVLKIDENNLEALTYLVLGHACLGTHIVMLGELKNRIESNPNVASNHAALSRLYMEMGKPDLALQSLERAQVLDPNLPSINFLFGRFYADFDEKLDLTRAIQEYTKSIEKTNDPAAYINLFFIYHRDIGDQFEAVKTIERYQKHYPVGKNRCREYAKSLVISGEIERGVSQVFKCLEAAQEDGLEYNDLGIVLFMAERYDEARELYEKAIEKFGKRASVGLAYRYHLNLGKVLNKLGEPQKALTRLEKGISYGVQDHKLYYSAGVSHLLLGNNLKAKENFAKCVEMTNNCATGRYFEYLIDHYPTRRFSKEDIEIIEYPLGRRSKSDRLARAGLGYINYAMYDEADMKFKKALELDPKNGVAWSGFVRALNIQDKFDKAIEIGKGALDKGIEHPWLLNNIGLAFHKKGDDREALKYYQRAFKLNPQSRFLNVNMAEALEELGEHDDSKHHYWLAGINPTFDPLGPYRPYAIGLAVILLILLVVYRRTQKPS